MKVLKIPAYSYFGTTSYNMPMNLFTNSALCQSMATQFPGTGRQRIWFERDISKPTIAKICNSKIGSDVFCKNLLTYNVYNAGKPLVPEYVNWSNAVGRIADIDNKTVHITDNFNIGSNYNVIPTQTINTYNSSNLYRWIGNQSERNKFTDLYSTTSTSLSFISPSTTTTEFSLSVTVWPEDIFNDEGFITQEEAASLPNACMFDLNVTCEYDFASNTIGNVKAFDLYVTVMTSWWGDLYYVLHDFDPEGARIETVESDDNNPYGQDGSSHTGGGDGTGGGGSVDSIDPAQIPALPSINVAQLGLITMYNPSPSDVQALSQFLWSNAFDLDTYKKLFQDPMEGIIGLAIVPCSPTLAGSQNVKIGNIDTGVGMAVLASNWKEIDCGWCDVEKYVGCFLDADPYTKIDIYLPFIGMRPLSADDINGGSIHVVYHVDLLTGACACFIEHSERGVIYTYNGSCITNVPITAINFSGAIQNAVSAVISGIGMVAGAATGAAPITAMGAMGLLNSAANTAINSKPTIQRSGNLGGSAGILSILTPYVIIERPDMSVPYNLQHFVGQTCNITYTLGDLDGFTMCEYVHIEGCTGTAEEIKEIETLLKEGVYL